MAVFRKISLGSGVLDRMVQDPAFQKEFPFLKNPPRKPCGCKNRKAMKLDYNALKQRIAGLSDARKLVMKEMLGASRIEFVYRTASGPVSKVQF